ncbi:MAG: transporter substrate-binding domain-containing protein [Pseudomonadota bacterium]
MTAAYWQKRMMAAVLMAGALLCAPTQAQERTPDGGVTLNPAEQAWLRAHPVLTFSVDQNNPPLNFRRADADGESFGGASIDYADLVARKTGLKLRWVGSSWDEALKKAMAHEVDGVPGARDRPERRLRLNFSTPYLELPIAMATRSGHAEVRTLGEFAGLRVAVVRNTVRIPVIRSRCPACVVVEVDNPQDGMARVRARQADAYFDDLPVIQRHLGAGTKIALLYYFSEAATVRFALRNDEPLLLSIFNKGLAAIRPEEHQLIRTRWLAAADGVRVQRDLALSEPQRAWLLEHPVIRVGVMSQRAPVESVGEDGQLRGISVDMLKRAEEMLGVRFELVPMTANGAALEQVRGHQLDMLSATNHWTARQSYLSFSESYLSTPIVLFAPAGVPNPGGLPGLAGKRVMVLAGTTTAEQVQRDWPGVNLLPVDTAAQAITALRRGQASAFVGALMTGSHQLQEMGASDIRVAGETDYNVQFSFGVRSDWPQLVAILDQALAAIPKNERDTIRQRWSHIDLGRQLDYRPLGALGLAVLVALAFILQLRVMVKRRTAALESEVAIRRANEEELQHFRRHLQDLVVERTSELAAAKEAAVAGNLAKSVFLSNMSHELRTPLNAILGFSELLRHEANLLPAQRKTLDLINRSGENLLTLINDVLDMSKIEAERLEVERDAFDVVAMTADVVELLRVRAEAAQLALVFERGASCVAAVYGDEAKLRQALINLVGNAIKFTEHGGVTVRLDTAPLNGADQAEGMLMLQIEVQDSGMGISPDDQQHVFEPFVQVGAPHAQKGTGLGLSITRKLVELMGGQLQLASEAGVGSRFRIALPVQAAELPEVAAGRPRVIGLAPGQPTCRMLVVEDQMQNWLLLQRLLTDAGFEVRVATNGALGVETFLSWQPQLIWMDHRMPVMDGLEATRRIRGLEGGRAVKIVAVTASAFEDERAHVMAAGMDDFIRKPYRPDDIFDCLTRQLGLEFVRAAPVSPAGHAANAALQAEDLAVLPSELRAELRGAVVALDQGHLAALVEALASEHPTLAAAIVRMTVANRFRELCELLDAAAAEIE